MSWTTVYISPRRTSRSPPSSSSEVSKISNIDLLGRPCSQPGPCPGRCRPRPKNLKNGRPRTSSSQIGRFLWDRFVLILCTVHFLISGPTTLVVQLIHGRLNYVSDLNPIIPAHDDRPLWTWPFALPKTGYWINTCHHLVYLVVS